jgi:hypothetical protein
MATYGVAEITQAEGVMVVERRGDVDLDALSEQLMDIRNAISPILVEEPERGVNVSNVVGWVSLPLRGRPW